MHPQRNFGGGVVGMRRLSDVLKEEYGEKVYKLALSSGCTCPNRDGTLGYGGCTFCSEGGSGEFAAHSAPITQQIEEAHEAKAEQTAPMAGQIEEDITRQIEEAVSRISAKTNASRYIAYFQSFTNTYGDPKRLRALYLETIRRPEIAILSIGTRPDCIGPEMLQILTELNQIKPVWVELGLQTANDATAEAVHRGYPYAVFEETYHRLKSAGLQVIVHVIFGLPGETRDDMLNTVRKLAALEPAPDGVKLQMLQILRGSQLAVQYEEHPFPLLSMEEYIELVIDSLRILPEETVIHRMTGDGPRALLIAPLWCLDKKRVLNTLNRRINVSSPL